MAAPRVNFGHLNLLTLGVPFSLFLAGCLGPSSEGMPTPIQVPSLDQFARCDYTYPTGGAVPCENLAIPVPVFPDRPPVGWVCTGGFVEPADRDRAEYYFYWNPTENARGLLYIEPNVLDAHGGLLWDDAKGKLFEWKRDGKQGFVRVSDFVAEGNRVGVRIYGHSFATTTPSLANATLSPLWSVYTADKWLLWELSTPAENYYFQHMRPHFFDENAYTPEDIELKGADFDLEIKYNDSGGIGFEWGTPGDTRIC